MGRTRTDIGRMARTRVAAACVLGLGLWAGLAALPASAQASSDVVTVYDDALVYAGGFYDIEVKPVGFTPVDIVWRAKLATSSNTYKADLEDYAESPDYWAHGTKTLHLRWGTVCDEWLQNGSDDEDFGLLRMECMLKDEKGKWHDSDDFMIRVRSLSAFRTRLEGDGGVELASVTPASTGALTKLEMTLGESLEFTSSAPELPGWVAASEPRWEAYYDVLQGGKTVAEGFSRHEGGSLSFHPTEAGEYLVAPVYDLYLGNVTYSGVSASQHYYVSVKEPAAPPKPLVDVSSLAGTVIRFGDGYDGTPGADEPIPATQVIPTTATSAKATLNGYWQVHGPGGWKQASEVFEAGKDYRFVIEALPKGDTVFLPDTRLLDVTKLLSCNIYLNGSWQNGQTFYPSGGSLPTRLVFEITRASVPNPPAPAGPGADDFDLQPVDDPDPSEEPGGLTGWEEYPEGWRYFEGGTRVESAWRYLGGAWYWFGADGLMATGWLPAGDAWYWLGDDGQMATGWQLIGGSWYWFEDSGRMATGWQHIGGVWYWFEPSGVMATGWQLIGGTWYWFESGGAMATGWRVIGGLWYCFDESGAMLHDTWVGDYHLASDGHWDNG